MGCQTPRSHATHASFVRTRPVGVCTTTTSTAVVPALGDVVLPVLLPPPLHPPMYGCTAMSLEWPHSSSPRCWLSPQVLPWRPQHWRRSFSGTCGVLGVFRTGHGPYAMVGAPSPPLPTHLPRTDHLLCCRVP
jgi:hypothetical protein